MLSDASRSARPPRGRTSYLFSGIAVTLAVLVLAPPPASAAPTQRHYATLKAAPSVISATGGFVTFTGRIVTRRPPAFVTLLRNGPNNEPYRAGRRIKVNAQGRFKYRLHLDRPRQFYVRGGPRLFSTTETVRQRRALATKLEFDRGAQSGLLRGHVVPAVRGHAVLIQRQNGTVWKDIRRVHTDATGSFAGRAHADRPSRSPATVRFRAVVPANDGYLKATSRPAEVVLHAKGPSHGTVPVPGNPAQLFAISWCNTIAEMVTVGPEFAAPLGGLPAEVVVTFATQVFKATYTGSCDPTAAEGMWKTLARIANQLVAGAIPGAALGPALKYFLMKAATPFIGMTLAVHAQLTRVLSDGFWELIMAWHRQLNACLATPSADCSGLLEGGRALVDAHADFFNWWSSTMPLARP